MNYTLGLDIGVASVGWAVLENDNQGEPCHIADLGVRIFDAAEDPQTGASLAAPRREARSARRRIRRRRHRKERIKNLLIREGVVTQEELDSLFVNSGYEEDVYTLRWQGLERQLTPPEWVRVLIHLAQRRGYRSNSTAQAAKDGEQGVIQKAISENEQLMKEGNYRTIGECFCRDPKFQWMGPDGQIWRKTRNTAGEYHFTITRALVAQEVKALFSAQRQYGNPYAGEEFEVVYTDILLSQRHFDEGPGGDSPHRKGDLRGMCTFEPKERRAFKACYTFEYFKLLQDLNHIRIVSTQEDTRTLTPEERATLIQLALSSPTLDYAKLRTALSLPDHATFNMVRYQKDSTVAESEKKSKFNQMQSYHKLRKALDKVEKKFIQTLSTHQLDEIGTILSLYQADDKRIQALTALGLSQPCITALLPLTFSKTGNLSLTAMQKLIPCLEQGVRYDEACRQVYGDHRGHQTTQRYKTITLNPAFRQSGALDDIRNPVVLRAVSQTTKVLNAIIRTYGSPHRISIELARDLRNNFADRKKIENRQKAHQKTNESTMAQIETIKKGRPTGQDLVKFRLYQEQNGLCLYSGQQLNLERLFEPGYVDVDHIIPYSISFDDSYRNKVLVRAAENRQKGNRLPLEYLSGDPARREQFITLVERYVRDYRKRQKLLKEHLSPEDVSGFKERNLVDTQYITRAVYNLLNDHLEFAPTAPKKPVRAVNGAITDYLRKRLGLTKYREDGDLHHAMDAAVIAITTDGMIQKITNYAERRELRNRIFERYTDPTTGEQKWKKSYVDGETGELLSQKDFDEKYGPSFSNAFPEPWEGFRKELLARLSPDPDTEIRALHLPHYDPQQVVKPVFVSRMPRRSVSGAAHKETIRSKKKEGYFISKKPLAALKLDKNGEIDGYYNKTSDPLLYEALRQQLLAFGGDGVKAFAQPFHKPKKDGTEGPLVNSVKVEEKTGANVETCGGIAENGGMVRIDVYQVPDDGYYFIPVYTADLVKPNLPQKACVAGKSYAEWKPMQEEHFLFSLYAGDLIKVTAKKPINLKLKNKDAHGQPELVRNEWLVYYVGADRAAGAITITTHDRKYVRTGLGIKRLLSIEKYEVDPLGNYHKVATPEIRQSFQ